jgi:hypothetical protein
LRANYGHRFLHAEFAALYAEIQFVALPNRSVTPATAIVPQNYASLYVTPRLRLMVLPRARISPRAFLGGAYALYEQSAKLSNGQSATDKLSWPGHGHVESGTLEPAIARLKKRTGLGPHSTLENLVAPVNSLLPWAFETAEQKLGNPQRR